MIRSTSTLLRALAAALLGGSVAAAAPDDDRHYRTGIGVLSKGLNDLAEPEFRAYLRDHPEGAQATNARYSLAVCLVRLGRHADAAIELDRVIGVKDFEFAPDALLVRAQCAAALSDDSAAVRSLDELVGRFPDWGRLDHASAMLGESLFRLGRMMESRDSLATVVERWPRSPWADRAQLLCAMAQNSLGEHAAAAERAANLRRQSPEGEYAPHAALIEARHRHSQQDYQAAASLYSLASAGSGDVRAEALLGLARVARAMKDYPKAARAVEGALASEPAPSEDLAAALELERGRLLADRGEHDAAAKHLAASAARFSKSGSAADMLYERAAVLSKSGDDDAALEAWSEWRARFDSHDLAPDAALAEAWCAHRLGKFDRSLALCRSIAAEPSERGKDESLILLIAENEFAAGRFEESLHSYNALLREHPKSRHAWRAGVRRAVCHSNLGRDAEAESLLRQMLKPTDGQDTSLLRSAVTSLAGAALARKDWAKGESWFALLAETAGSSDEAIDAELRLGICIQRQGRPADAIPRFDRVIESGPDSASALQANFERGQSLLELDRLDDARASLEAVIARESGGDRFTPHALRHLASIASRQGRHSDAAAILSEVTPGSDSPEALLDLGAARMAAGQHAEAETAYAEFIRSSPSSARAPDARIHLAVAINRLGRHADALAALERVSNLDAMPAELRATANYERALALRSLDRDAESIEAYRAVLKDEGTRLAPYAALDLAHLESGAGRDEESLRLAEACLVTAESLAGPEAEALRERALYLQTASLHRLTRHADAAKATDEFITAFPKSELIASIRLLRGESFVALGNSTDAAREFALAAGSSNPPEVRATALLRLADAAAASQQWTKCEEAGSEFLSQFADSELWFHAKFAQGWARENQDRHDAAIEAYREVVSRHQGPTAARAQFQIGECLFAQKRHEQAVVELLKTDMLFAYPEWSAAALYEAGRCLTELGRHDDAAKQFDELTRRFPESEWARLALEKQRSNRPASIPGRSKAAL